MASSDCSSGPLMAGSTVLPKVPLSYRWVISDAESFLGKRSSLTSPLFSTPLPLKSYKKVFWRISVEKNISKNSTYRMTLQYDRNTTEGSQQTYHPPPVHTNFGFTLNSAVVQQPSPSQVSISDCSFSLLNRETNECVFNATVPHIECSIGYSTDCSTEAVSFDLHKYVFNDSLTIKVDATILCHSDPVETQEETACKVPMDDIRKELHSLYQDKIFADVTIRCKKKEFMAHKVILASQSPVFKRMFASDMKESRSNVVTIDDISPAVMFDLLAYIYSGTAPHLSTLAKQLLEAANKYQISRLTVICENELKEKLNVQNVVETLLWANLLSEELKAACLRFIHLHSTEVKSSDGWKHLKNNAEKYSSLLVEIMEYTV